MLLKITNFIRGYYVISVFGINPLKLINSCAKNNISVWAVKKKTDNEFLMHIRPKSFDFIVKTANTLGCQAKILKHFGLFSILKGLKKRYALLSGLLIVFALLFALTNFIWVIDINGNESLPDTKILKSLSELSVKPGTFKGKIDQYLLKNEMLLKLPELSFFAINISGSRASIEVRERTAPPEIIDKKTPCDIISTRDAIITKMTVLNGIAKKHVGYTVLKGDVLVTGAIETEGLPIRLVHSMAEVTGSTKYTLKAKRPAERLQKSYTGKKKSRFSFLFVDKKIRLYFKYTEPFKSCDKLTETSCISFFGKISLPFGIIKESFYEYKLSPAKANVEKLSQITLNYLKTIVEKNVKSGKIVSVSSTKNLQGSLLCVQLVANCEEQIAKKSKVTMPPPPPPAPKKQT